MRKGKGGSMTKKTAGSPAMFDRRRIVERPDGFYWQGAAGGREYGPFSSLVEAQLDMDGADLDEGAAGLLRAAESEIGIADWIDRETGQPAEDSIPHLEDDV